MENTSAPILTKSKRTNYKKDLEFDHEHIPSERAMCHITYD